MLISKEDHKKFIDQLHEMHTQETSRLKDQAKLASTKLEQAEKALARTNSLFEQEKSVKANVYNELQYSKMQLTQSNEELKSISAKLVQLEQNLKQAQVKGDMVDRLE